MFFNILLLLELFSKAINDRNKNSSPSIKKSTSFILLSNIVLGESSNFLFRPFNNYGKIKKIKYKLAFTFWGLGDLDYITN